MQYHLLEHQGGVEIQTRKARVMTTPEGSSRYKCIRKPLLHNKDQCKVIFSLENLQQRFRNRLYFQIKDLRHPDGTSIRATADDVNFVTNAEYVYCT